MSIPAAGARVMAVAALGLLGALLPACVGGGEPTASPRAGRDPAPTASVRGTPVADDPAARAAVAQDGSLASDTTDGDDAPAGDLAMEAAVTLPIVALEYAGAWSFWQVHEERWSGGMGRRNELLLQRAVGRPALERAVDGSVAPQPVRTAPDVLGFPVHAARVPDLNGDGRIDWLLVTSGPVSVTTGRATRSDGSELAFAFPTVPDYVEDRRRPILLVSGADGALLREHVATEDAGPLLLLPDVDGDGVSDYAAGMLLGACAWSGATGAKLWEQIPDDERDGSVVDLLAWPDENGDGLEDVLLVRASWSLGARPSPGADLLILDAAHGGILRSLRLAERVFTRGAPVARLGDLDGDGLSELAVGLADADAVAILSGADGATLRRIPAPPGSSGFGTALLMTADYDGDGTGELFVGAPNGGGPDRDEPSHLYLVSPTSGAILFALRGRREADGMAFFATAGRRLAEWRDLDGDGRPELVFEERHYAPLIGGTDPRASAVVLSSEAITRHPHFRGGD